MFRKTFVKHLLSVIILCINYDWCSRMKAISAVRLRQESYVTLVHNNNDAQGNVQECPNDWVGVLEGKHVR